MKKFTPLSQGTVISTIPSEQGMSSGGGSLSDPSGFTTSWWANN
jgi:hypothetical protein